MKIIAMFIIINLLVCNSYSQESYKLFTHELDDYTLIDLYLNSNETFTLSKTHIDHELNYPVLINGGTYKLHHGILFLNDSIREYKIDLKLLNDTVLESLSSYSFITANMKFYFVEEAKIDTLKKEKIKTQNTR